MAVMNQGKSLQKANILRTLKLKADDVDKRTTRNEREQIDVASQQMHAR
jgi:hypothetical protein